MGVARSCARCGWRSERARRRDGSRSVADRHVVLRDIDQYAVHRDGSRMTRIRWRAVLIVGTLVLVVGLPLAGWWARRDAGPKCAFDGLPIEPHYRVVIIDARGKQSDFCCVRCAERWLEQRTPAEVLVADESTGELIDARSAWFVRSNVMTNPVTRNRVHAFRDRTTAKKHADAFAGDLLKGTDRPLQLGLPAPGEN